MSTVAEQLRQARETRKLTVHQIAEITKIRTDHIRALEEGNFDVFSAPVYIRGFVRTYATLLKLDVPGVMAELDAELGRTEKFSEPPPLTDQKRGPLDVLTLLLSRVNWRKGFIGLAILAGMLILLSAVVNWWHDRTRDPLRGLKPGVYQPTNKNAGQRLPAPAPARRK